HGMVGPFELKLNPQEVPWDVPLDEDREHATYDASSVATYFGCATHAALALHEFRAPYRGRSTPVHAWWGSFDLAVSLFSGDQEVAAGWWPGDPSYAPAAFYAYAKPAPEGFGGADLEPPGTHWDGERGLYLLDWRNARAATDPHATAVQFMRSAFDRASPPPAG
ncbi:MAG: DUF5996 family protein, partial [Actinobacteria bacterium]|nr:DUF5996 family protein [Actinomycetota bacterium]